MATGMLTIEHLSTQNVSIVRGSEAQNSPTRR